jgi:Trehalase
MKVEISRRSALKLLGLGSAALAGNVSALGMSRGSLDTSAAADALTATLRWNYPTKPDGDYLVPYRGILLEISEHEDMRSPVASIRLADDVDYFRVAVVPNKSYYWRIAPIDDAGKVLAENSTGTFNTAAPVIDDTNDDRIRYKNPRVGAHWEVSKEKGVVPFGVAEPLAPWYSEKSYLGPAPPHFEQIKSLLPVPVLESDNSMIELYWYCWKTFFDLWLFPPTAPNHQAVANLVGLRSWSVWGSTMVWDTAFMLHFARYANLAYSFITAFDNCYARQHENGFISRESDSQNLEVYSGFPLNPPLFAWAEWEYFQISNDSDRLRRTLPPIVKHYEWYMTYQRRRNGLYWTDGFNEADDSPRNTLMYYAASATSYQALSALYLAKIADQLGRADLVAFFTSEHQALGQLVNKHFWDAKHSLYNDVTKDGQFITELEPGVLCKHVHMFWPLIAQVADEKGVEGLVAELTNPKSFYRSSGIPSLSADSKEYREDGQYWKGSVWPPVQCMVQEGLRENGRRNLARDLAQKYLKAVAEAYQQQHTITENLAPDTAKGYGVKDFVGWGGIGPVSNLIEYVLGFEVNAPEKTVEWRIERIDRHGITNLPIGNFTASMICERRADSKGECHVNVESNGVFTLRLFLGDRSTDHPIRSGHNEIVVS